MNLRYLGDALDHWKGSLLEHLQNGELLRDLAIDPMTSDDTKWQEEDWDLFARLLRVKRRQIVSHTHSLAGSRRSYFREIGHNGDLFLDSDTGIATGKVSTPVQYVLAPEVHDLLGREPARVVAIYQHIRAQRTRDRLQSVVAALQRPGLSFACCSYESGSVAMLFFSREQHRIDRIHDGFVSLLKKHADRRIYRWYHMLEHAS